MDSETGVMQTGWFRDSTNTWYLADASGTMKAGWLWDDTWYWLDLESGAMATGWKLVANSWYYFDGSGVMAFSRLIGDYYVGASGAMVANGYTPDGYYCGSDGSWRYMY